MKYVWVAQCSDYLEVFATKKLAEEILKKKGLRKRYAFWVDKNQDKYDITEYDVSLTKRKVRK